VPSVREELPLSDCSARSDWPFTDSGEALAIAGEPAIDASGFVHLWFITAASFSFQRTRVSAREAIVALDCATACAPMLDVTFDIALGKGFPLRARSTGSSRFLDIPKRIPFARCCVSFRISDPQIISRIGNAEPGFFGFCAIFYSP